MVDDEEIRGGWALTCTLEPKIEALDEGLTIYKRRKRRKMNHSDGYDDKIEAVNGSAFDQYVQRLSLGAFSNGPGECSLKKCSNIVLQQKPPSLNAHEACIQNALVTTSESDPTPVINEYYDNVERSNNQTDNTAQEPSHFPSSGSLKQPEGSTNSELCAHALSDTLNSEKFSDLRSLFLKNFGVVNVNRVTNVDAIKSKLKNGAYETSPMLYLKDILQVWAKLQQVGNEMVTLANSLSDKSRAHYEQFVGKLGCKGCGEKADVKSCLVCDSCEDMYHLSCTELVSTSIPLKSWYCANCVSNGIGSPHDSCVVCEKLKSAASLPLVKCAPTNNQSQDVVDWLDEHLDNGVTDESQIQSQSQNQYVCFICKSEVKIDEKFRTCGHSLCSHKFYHDKCLTTKQLGVYGPYWYCPSCLCRHCLEDKDDDRIVLCDGCDQAYHIYCTSPQLTCIPEGNWFCEKCDRELQRIKTVRRMYESMQKKVKVEDESQKDEREATVTELEGLDMLVTAAKTLSNEDPVVMRDETVT
ncbi:putative [histone H3]-lysine(4) N-trimethyltransferase chromatin regulator PHD family [Helianthus annuus]|nr:putative [histone H3]-lysine(4) N-trimethyltransferase chromatin regulator PHD family [Helianthus annuus]